MKVAAARGLKVAHLKCPYCGVEKHAFGFGQKRTVEKMTDVMNAHIVHEHPEAFDAWMPT